MKKFLGTNKIVVLALSVFSIITVGVTFRTVGTIQSYNYDVIAPNVPIFYPRTLEDVQALIKDAYNRNVNVRFSGTSHSTNTVILGSGIYIKSENFNQILGIEDNSQYGLVVNVESGVKLGDLHEYLAQHGYSLGFAYPFYYGISIGGLLSTGSHGSSRRHLAQSSQNIMEMTLVNGLGDQVVVSPDTPEMLKAARVSLGLLGFVYKVKLRIYKDFNIQFRSHTLAGETALLKPDGQVNWGNVADSEYVYWYPQANRGLKVEGVIVDKPADRGAQCVVLGANHKDDIQARLVGKLLKIGKHNRFLNKTLEDQMYKNILGPPPYERIVNQKTVQAQDVVGPSAKMLLSKKASLIQAFSASDFSFSFRIQDAPKVLGQIHEFSKKNNLSFPLVGIFMRFASGNSSSYLSHIERPGSAGDVYVMAEYYEPKDFTNLVPASQWADMTHEMLKMLVKQNLISFHWGKSTDKVFSYQANRKLIGENVSAFNRVRQEMDPKGIFVNDFAKNFILD